MLTRRLDPEEVTRQTLMARIATAAATVAMLTAACASSPASTPDPPRERAPDVPTTTAPALTVSAATAAPSAPTDIEVAPPPTAALKLVVSHPGPQLDLEFNDSISTDGWWVAALNRDRGGEGEELDAPERLVVREAVSDHIVRVFDFVDMRGIAKNTPSYLMTLSKFRKQLAEANDWLAGKSWRSLASCEIHAKVWTRDHAEAQPVELRCEGNNRLLVELRDPRLRVVLNSKTVVDRPDPTFYANFPDESRHLPSKLRDADFDPKARLLVLHIEYLHGDGSPSFPPTIHVLKLPIGPEPVTR